MKKIVVVVLLSIGVFLLVPPTAKGQSEFVGWSLMNVVDRYIEYYRSVPLGCETIDLNSVVLEKSLIEFEKGRTDFLKERLAGILESYEIVVKNAAVTIEQDNAVVELTAEVTATFVNNSSFTKCIDYQLQLIKREGDWLISSVKAIDDGCDIYSDLDKNWSEASKQYIVRKQCWVEAAALPLQSDTDQTRLMMDNYRAYNRSAAAEYAYTYSCEGDGGYTDTNYNHYFKEYIPNDCANFGSQVIWYGFGGVNTQESIESHALPMHPSKWWADSTDCVSDPYNWTYQPDLVEWILNNYTNDDYGVQGYKVSLSQVQPGDLVYYDRTGDISGHVMMVNRIEDINGNGIIDSEYEVRICAHTYNHRDYPLGAIGVIENGYVTPQFIRIVANKDYPRQP